MAMRMNREEKEMAGEPTGALIVAMQRKMGKDTGGAGKEIGKGAAMPAEGALTLTWPVEKTPELEGKSAGDTVELKGVPVDITATVSDVSEGMATISVNALDYSEGEAESPVLPEAEGEFGGGFTEEESQSPEGRLVEKISGKIKAAKRK